MLGNYIGTDASGSSALPNGAGVEVVNEARNNVIGGSSSGAGNVISGNSGVGVALSGMYTDDNTIQNNLIGVGADGSQPLGNGTFGVQVRGGTSNNFIAGNTIAANGTGIRVSDPGTTGNTILSNFIGTNADLDGGLGNVNEGVYISNAAGNTVGSAIGAVSLGEAAAGAEGNVIRNNGAAGVRIQDSDAVHNVISANSIDNNAGLGIELDNGANDGQAAPVLISAVTTGSTEIVGSLASTPNAAFTIEFFASPSCDASGDGEGRDYLGSAVVNTNGSGDAAIDATLAGSLGGQAVTATATNADGDTSQFSNCVAATGPTPTPTPTATPTATPTLTPAATPSPTSDGAALLGDADCSGAVDALDALAALGQSAGAPPGAPCADRADADCDADVDEVDALRILLFAAALPMPQPGGCGDIGSPLT